MQTDHKRILIRNFLSAHSHHAYTDMDETMEGRTLFQRQPLAQLTKLQRTTNEPLLLEWRYSGVMLLSDRIKALAPANAVSYRLKLKHTDGTVRTFPPNPGAYFELGESPYGMPNATYFLCFYDEENRPISHPERRLNIDVQDELPKPSQAQLSMSFMNAQREPAPPRPLHPAGPKRELPGNEWLRRIHGVGSMSRAPQ